MTVEEIRGSVVSDNAVDKFPIGMRVLAVDDNPTCLKVLDSLLRKCQYHVTTTNEAAKALKMLRENRNRFDLIISDVYMPDMDGFKLLELVGLEMDLPVIMLSGNSDPKLVMKGITHGACDYLVKPVRLEELRNIWQHVIRRKVETKSKSKSNNNERSAQGNDGGDQIVKVNRKRRDEDDDDENDDSDDPSSNQKRPRVVWSIDLHKKFVAAVNQLGVEKAVPKRILDLMNVDGLTRENVASHLQKYRLYLRRISQHANMIVAFGGGNDASSYTRMSVLDVIGDFRTVSNSGRLPNSVYAGSGMLGRLNSTSGLTLHSLAAKPFVQPNHTQNQLQASTSSQPPNHQNVNRLLGIPSSFDLDNQQYGNKPNAQLTDFGSTKESQIFSGTKLADFTSFDESRMLTGSRTFADPSAVLATQSSLKLPSANSEPFNLLSGSRTFADPKAVLATQSSLKPPSTHSEPFNLFSDSRTFADPSAVLSTQSSLKPPSTHSEPFNLLSDSRTFANPSAVLSTQSSLKPPSTHSEPFNLFSGSRTFADPSAVLESQSSLKLPSTDSESFNLLSGSRTFADPSAVLASQSSLNLPYTDSEPFNLLSGNRTFADPNAVLPSQSSLKLPSTDSESFNLLSDGSCFLDQDCHKSGSFSSNQLTFGESYSYTATGTGDFGSNITITPTVPLEANGGSGFVSDIVPNVNQSLPNQYQQSQNCGNLDYSQYSHNAFSSSPDSGLVGVGGVLSGLMNHTRSNDGASTLNQIQSPSMHSTEDYLDQTKLQDGFFASNGYGSFDDIMTGMKKQDQDPTSIMAGDFGYDHYSFGSCK